MIADFQAGKVDRVFVIYNEFKNAGSQSVKVKQILPVMPEKVVALATTPGAAHKAGESDEQADYLYEPGKQQLLDRLVPLYVQIMLYRAALESITSFFAAQMTAMQNATKNAGDMISALTLQFNRARQASITKELAEIVGGAEALKG